MVLKLEIIKHRLGVFSVVWIIITSGGVMLNHYSVVPYTLIFDVTLVFSQFMLVRKALRFNERAMFYVLLVACVILSVIANSDYESYLAYARLLLIIALAFGSSLLLANEVIAETFVKFVVGLAGVSIIFFYTGFLEGNAGLFPVLEFADRLYVNAFVYLFHDNADIRNLGIFIEPGLYQIYLNMALFILLFGGGGHRHEKPAILVLLVTLYSTHSTTGYIVGLLIISGHLIVSNKNKNKKSMFFSVSKVLMVLLALGLASMQGFFQKNIDEKFSGKKSMSYVYRINASLADLQIISENPLTGAGIGNYRSLLDIFDRTVLPVVASANTFSQLGALVGLPFVLIILWRVGVFTLHLNIVPIGRWIFLTMYIISFSTEPFILYPLFYLPVFMVSRQLRSPV